METLTATQSKSLALPAGAKVRSLLQVLLASFFIGITAKISIPLPFTPVPLSGLTFGIMLTSGFLGGKRGAFAAMLYLMQGILGAPVWASGAYITYLMGATGGYLIGCPIAAFLFGTLVEKRYTLAAVLVPTSLQLAMGSLWLFAVCGAKSALYLGFYPFIALEVIKAIAVVYAVKLCKKAA